MTVEGLWRIGFDLPAAPALPIMEALEDRALSVSVFEIEADDFQETVRWRVELLRSDEPDIDKLKPNLAALLSEQSLEPKSLTIDFLPHENWLEKAAMPRPPQRLGRFFVHGANDVAPVQPGLVGLTIDVGMAFGSGEHGSTSGCLLAFDQLLRKRRFQTVLDMGCGSAILAIAAARAMRCQVLAADNDPLAVEVARRNTEINSTAHRIECLVSDGYAHPKIRHRAPFELIFANILADPLCDLAPGLKRHLARGGYAILAGLLDRQASMVIDAHRRQGLRLAGRVDLAPWTTLILKRTGK